VSAVAFATDQAAELPFSDVPTPTSGSLDYEGYLELNIVSAAAAADIDGIAVFSIDLSDHKISDTIDGFRGMVRDPNTNDYLVSYDGVLDIIDGGLSLGADDEAAVFMVIDGNLDNGLNLFTINGEVEGTLKGDSGGFLFARGTSSGLDGYMDVTIDANIAAISSIGTLSAELVPTPP
jgi:hypothetical protein